MLSFTDGWIYPAQLEGVVVNRIPHMEPSQPDECDTKPLDVQFAFE